MQVEVDQSYISDLLLKLLEIHSPTGYTDPIIRYVCRELDNLGIEYELTRRGAIRATLPGEISSPDRAVVTHVDTLGAMVKALKPNGRLAVVPVGTWSARFAEGARVSVFTDNTIYRGTLLPLKASGHTYDSEIDSQPVSWDNMEVRIDAELHSTEDLQAAGFHVGDHIGIDASAEFLPNGFINARHLDDKAGVAALLGASKWIKDNDITLPSDMHLLFTISEEVGSGASAILHGDIAEMVSVDNATCAPGQNSDPYGITIAMADSSGPFDYHLNQHLIQLCQHFQLQHARDIFRYYRCDSASAVEAGNDIRTALIAFGVDGSHGYERTHIRSLLAVAHLLIRYAVSTPLYIGQSLRHNTLSEFPETRTVAVNSLLQEENKPIVQTTPKPESELDDIPDSDAH